MKGHHQIVALAFASLLMASLICVARADGCGQIGAETCRGGATYVCTRLTAQMNGWELKNPYERCVVNVPSISGVYQLYDIGNGKRVTSMQIIQSGSSIQVRGIGQSWSGIGALSGHGGYYDWRFADGKSGRTNFQIGANGTLTGHVLGSGINWSFVGHR